MPDWSWIGSLLDFCTAYYTTQLVRCAAFSFVLTGLVMLLRKVFFSRRTFIRGLLWSSFLLIPFLGKLKLFYENEAVAIITGRITHETMTCLWADRIYMAGILIAAVCIFGKRLRLRKAVAGMEKVSLDNMQVRITDMNVTPFTVGLFAPKIVIPKVMLESYSREELRSVIQHERTHIRLGHLWFGLAWDVLRLSDACALVKVEVLQANSENVRNYIYTSYDMKVVDVLYGTVDADGDTINVNMPGGTVQEEKAQKMLSEVTEGKNAGDLSGINQIVSDGNTDRLLSVGDEAYLFLMKESETSFAVVGEYRGEMLLENGKVYFDSCIIRFKDGITTHGLENGSMVESEFIEAINELIYKDS